MDAKEFRICAREMVDYVANYHETIDQRPVVSSKTPGYLRSLLPSSAPDEGEEWKAIMEDVEDFIMPGVTHWQHPCFFAYFPIAHSFAATCADILSDSLGCMGFTWHSCPAYTELEVIVLDWLVQLLGLPAKFLSSGPGGGVINNSASEVALTMMCAARKAFFEEKKKESDFDIYSASGRLVGYYTEEAHSSVERAGLVAMIRMRAIRTDAEHHSMCPDALEAAIKEDLEKGLWPFFVCAALGSTNSCAFDSLEKVGPICEKHRLWLHVDAAYAGSFFACPELRSHLAGVDFVTSFNFNPHKALLVNFDCSVVWVADRRLLTSAFEVNPVYLKSDTENPMPDFRHWHIALGRRFRSLKIWFVLRVYGVKGVQNHLRDQVKRAEEFLAKVRADEDFEVVAPPELGLVCFRIKGDNAKTEALLAKIREDGRIHLVPGKFKDVFFLRFVVCYSQTESKHIDFAFDVIRELANHVMSM